MLRAQGSAKQWRCGMQSQVMVLHDCVMLILGPLPFKVALTIQTIFQVYTRRLG